MDRAICSALATTPVSATVLAEAFLSMVATATFRMERIWPSQRSRRTALVSATLRGCAVAGWDTAEAGESALCAQAIGETVNNTTNARHNISRMANLL